MFIVSRKMVHFICLRKKTDPLEFRVTENAKSRRGRFLRKELFKVQVIHFAWRVSAVCMDLNKIRGLMFASAPGKVTQ